MSVYSTRFRLQLGPARHGPAANTLKVRPSFNQLFSFSKLVVVVLGPVSVEELVSVEDAPSARFACYGIKINILTCIAMVLGLMENRVDGT